MIPINLKSIWDNAWPFLAAALVLFLAYRVSTHLKSHYQLQADLKTEQAQVDTLQTRLAQTNAASAYVVEAAERAAEIREVTRTIIKEVPVYVTPEADAACTVPPGFVRVHDAAAIGVPVDHPAVAPDATAAAPALSAVAGTVAANYGTCNELRQQLIGLQGYISSFQEKQK
jgi:hypothetical protein